MICPETNKSCGLHNCMMHEGHCAMSLLPKDTSSQTPPTSTSDSELEAQTSREDGYKKRYDVIIHNVRPHNLHVRSCAIACLVPMVPLPPGYKLGGGKEPYLVACLRHADEVDYYEWAVFDDPQWREDVGVALLEAKVRPGEWKWISLYDAESFKEQPPESAITSK